MKTTVLSRTILPWTLGLCLATALDAQTAWPCKVKEARQEFVSFLEMREEENWRAAISHLEKATKLCPIPSSRIDVPLIFFNKVPYVPFYSLGTCHYKLKENSAALRQFYLSSCFDEPSRGETPDLDSLTNTCFNSIKKSRRPDKHGDFADGYTALQQREWEKSAEKMWDSLQAWNEDGETTYSQGRWPEAYLPHFQLAKALHKLGCEQLACEQLEQSMLEDLIAKQDGRVKNESREFQSLKAACSDGVKGRQQDQMTCLRWECWLKEKGR
jgi:hypothetical protein